MSWEKGFAAENGRENIGTMQHVRDSEAPGHDEAARASHVWGCGRLLARLRRCARHASVAASQRQVRRPHQKLDPCLERRSGSKEQETGRKVENRFRRKLLSLSSSSLPPPTEWPPTTVVFLFHPFQLRCDHLSFLDFKFVPRGAFAEAGLPISFRATESTFLCLCSRQSHKAGGIDRWEVAHPQKLSLFPARLAQETTAGRGKCRRRREEEARRGKG